MRTKKRFFIPPAVNLKEKQQENPEARARAAGIVFRQEYVERSINVACSGNKDLFAYFIILCLCKDLMNVLMLWNTSNFLVES